LEYEEVSDQYASIRMLQKMSPIDFKLSKLYGPYGPWARYAEVKTRPYLKKLGFTEIIDINRHHVQKNRDNWQKGVYQSFYDISANLGKQQFLIDVKCMVNPNHKYFMRDLSKLQDNESIFFARIMFRKGEWTFEPVGFLSHEVLRSYRFSSCCIPGYYFFNGTTRDYIKYIAREEYLTAPKMMDDIQWKYDQGIDYEITRLERKKILHFVELANNQDGRTWIQDFLDPNGLPKKSKEGKTVFSPYRPNPKVRLRKGIRKIYEDVELTE